MCIVGLVWWNLYIVLYLFVIGYYIVDVEFDVEMVDQVGYVVFEYVGDVVFVMVVVVDVGDVGEYMVFVYYFVYFIWWQEQVVVVFYWMQEVEVFWVGDDYIGDQVGGLYWCEVVVVVLYQLVIVYYCVQVFVQCVGLIWFGQFQMDVNFIGGLWVIVVVEQLQDCFVVGDGLGVMFGFMCGKWVLYGYIVCVW